MMDAVAAQTAGQKARLQKLSETVLTVADPEADVRDHTVLDSEGNEIGHVSDLIIDEEERRVRFLEVSSGGFLGLGATKFLIPVEAIVNVDDHHVFLGHSRRHVADSPAYEPNLVKDPDWGAYYGYYGYTPYWTMQTPAPPFPVVPKPYV
jgi:sporulation protein YlmC with PRC-barrel domain